MHLRAALLAAGLACTFTISSVSADEAISITKDGVSAGPRADGHAPIGVMDDHMHKEGGVMLSFRYMHMDMEGNRIGTGDIDPATIATTIPNRFFGMPGQPPTLRVVPTSMTMDMYMLGAMYAPTDWLTLMAMGNYTAKEMDHITFAGAAGTTVLGTFTTTSHGIGDTKLTGLIRLFDGAGHHLHLNAGLSIPTGSIDNTATVLAPTGMRPNLRMPYAMQLGTGTFDFLPGVTYTGRAADWGWGAQYLAEVRLEGENSEGYAWGDKHSFTAWGSYQWAQWISTSARLLGTTQGSIDGIDPKIVAPVQTADPNYYGGDVISMLLGVNLIATEGTLKGQRLAIEAGLPVYQDLNGPQLETDWTITAGWQYAF